MNTTQLRVTGRIEPVSSSAYTKTEDFPAAGTWSTWPASDRYPRCSLLPPPHSHVPAQDARGEGGSRILNTTSLSSARTWVRSPPWEHRVLGEPCPSWRHRSAAVITQQAWAASLTGESWEPGLRTTRPPTSHCTGQDQSGPQVWTLMRVEIIRRCYISVDFIFNENRNNQGVLNKFDLKFSAWDLAFLTGS